MHTYRHPTFCPRTAPSDGKTALTEDGPSRTLKNTFTWRSRGSSPFTALDPFPSQVYSAQ